MKGLKGLLGGLMEGMKDDKGLFQGGVQDRAFGRGRDAVANLFGGGEMKRARKFAKGFDPGSEDDTLKMQQMLNSLGITDSEGNELKEDSMFGGKTESALRSLQSGESVMPEEESAPEETSFDYEPGKGPSGPIDPWSETEGESTMMRNASGSSPKSWIDRLFGGNNLNSSIVSTQKAGSFGANRDKGNTSGNYGR